MGIVPESAPSDHPAWSSHPLRDSCGVRCQHVTLPDCLNATAAATLFIVPGRCVVLEALPDVQWTTAGVRTFAYRVAGRIPTVLDLLPPSLADALADEIVRVLDWVGTPAA